jgi:hypothetical protein
MKKIKPKYLMYIRTIPIVLVAAMVLCSFGYLKEHPNEDEVNVLSIGFALCMAICILALAIIGAIAKRDLPDEEPFTKS